MNVGLEAELAEAFARHRYRLRRDGFGVPAEQLALEQALRSLVRLCDHRCQPLPKLGDSERPSDDGQTMLLTRDEVARQLKVSRRTVDRLTATGALVAVAVGPQALRVRAADLASYVANLKGRQ